MPSCFKVLLLSTWLAAAGAPSSQAVPATPTPAPYLLRTGTVPDRPSWKVVAVTPDLARTKLVAAMPKVGTPAAPLGELAPDQALVVFNGGYFDRAYKPTTWVVSDRRELHQQNRAAAGGVVAVRGEQVYVGPLAGLSFKPEFAVQNTPLLVDKPGRIAKLKDSDRRAARTVACLADGKLQLLVIYSGPGAGPTLRETAELLIRPVKDGGFACTAAVNLDGGSSTGVWFPADGGAGSLPPLVPIGYGIALVPRQPR